MRNGWSLTRFLILAFLALNVVAIGLGRMVGPNRSWRKLGPVRCVGLNGYLSFDMSPGVRYLDLDSGRDRRFPLPEEDLFDQASWSPWQDENGASQVVGRWTARS